MEDGTRRAYTKPELHHLGTMSRVTRKTDKWAKPGTMNDPHFSTPRRKIN